MTSPIGLQLYSVREQLNEDFPGTIEKIAQMGYTGVETYDLPETIKPNQAKAIFDDNGLVVISSHSPMPLGEDKDKVLDTLASIGCPHLVSPSVKPDYYSSTDNLQLLAELFNESYQVASQHDMKFSIHNHAFEFSLLNDEPAIFTLIKYLEPGINFELDTYWIKVAGFDPSKMVSTFGKRAPLLHIKDSLAIPDGDMTAVGDGILDIPAIIKAGEPNTEWLIVELDRCATDMLEALEKSFSYLSELKF